ncbi:uncharacterized protein DNG_09942 [Cephalotrichum gorgonifer]|uniref:Uncharacterized protein n=1 Tax=Cephalotrichum gorgonifer TaxID=2041049 RepID=A0AAE8N8B2_9PEZI|nr:uncharacterized protein DNG_09942 [Cephalotrichum gorgonifer]
MAFLSRFRRDKAPREKLTPLEHATRRVHQSKCVQIAALVLNLVLMAALAGYISSQEIGVGAGIIVPIIMAGVAFIITGLGNWFGQHVGGYTHRWYLVLLIIADFACIGVQIAAFIVLTVAKVPAHCTGLTGISYRPNDPSNKPKAGYDTIGFGQPNEKGELDDLCPIPRVSWLISLLLMISYIYSVGRAIRLIVALKRNLRQQAELESQTSDARILPGQPPATAPPAPLPRYHVNVPIITPSDTGSSHTQPTYSVSTDVPTPVASPPPYDDEGSGSGIVADKKFRRWAER